jgi:hypothetical protein
VQALVSTRWETTEEEFIPYQTLLVMSGHNFKNPGPGALGCVLVGAIRTNGVSSEVGSAFGCQLAPSQKPTCLVQASGVKESGVLANSLANPDGGLQGRLDPTA